MLLFKGENEMNVNHTKEVSVHIIKYTDSLYVRSVNVGGVELVFERRLASEYGELDLNQIKNDVAQMIKLGLKKDNISIVEESEVVIKKKTEMTVDSLNKINLATVNQDVWERM